jgi:hypothetical protein
MEMVRDPNRIEFVLNLGQVVADRLNEITSALSFANTIRRYEQNDRQSNQ